jgi:hypothetical protein
MIPITNSIHADRAYGEFKQKFKKNYPPRPDAIVVDDSERRRREKSRWDAITEVEDPEQCSQQQVTAILIAMCESKALEALASRGAAEQARAQFVELLTVGYEAPPGAPLWLAALQRKHVLRF